MRTLEEITAKCLTDVLRKHEDRKSVTVRSVDIVLKKELPYSTVARLRVEYETPNSALPNDLFIKLTPGSVTDSHAMGIGKTEVDFYTTVAPLMQCPPLIRSFGAAFSNDAERSYILMEDLSATYSQPEQNNAPSETLSRSAIQALAKVHSALWSSPRLGRDIGQLFDQKMLGEFVANLEKTVSDFIERSGVMLLAEHREAYRLMLIHSEQIWGRLMDQNGLTITHGDCHWWNFLYPNDPINDAVRIYDWHLWHVDLGARDLAYILAFGGFAEPRPELEPSLLAIYYETLLTNGITNYSFESLSDDYRWSAIRNLNLPVIFWSQGKHESTWTNALRRSFESYQRLNCQELVT